MPPPPRAPATRHLVLIDEVHQALVVGGGGAIGAVSGSPSRLWGTLVDGACCMNSASLRFSSLSCGGLSSD